MSDTRIATDLWVMAHVRRSNSEGIPATVARRGDRSGGTVLLKLNQLEAGCRVLVQARGPDGKLGWLAALGGGLVAEGEADEYIARAVGRDPDLWVIEVEDRHGRNPFAGLDL
ncbi:MAG: DUF1491 family protein [Alphaproteobacteria bacterium]|nr:DUF1491 family protein [Alphaproteobacteria bacterium]